MPLPTLETATYKTTIPSTGKSIEYRPFLVKEEKVLLLAQESNEVNEIVRALKNIINTCTFEKINIDELATYDLEYLFLQIRGKSVGENVSLDIKCEECETINNISLDLSSIKVKKPRKQIDPKIQLTDDVGIVMRHIPVGEMENISENSDLISMISICIDSIYDANNVYSRNDCSTKELNEFVESLSHKHLELIDQYISNQPKLSHKVKFNCSSCNKKFEQELDGLQDFFI